MRKTTGILCVLNMPLGWGGKSYVGTRLEAGNVARLNLLETVGWGGTEPALWSRTDWPRIARESCHKASQDHSQESQNIWGHQTLLWRGHFRETLEGGPAGRHWAAGGHTNVAFPEEPPGDLLDYMPFFLNLVLTPHTPSFSQPSGPPAPGIHLGLSHPDLWTCWSTYLGLLQCPSPGLCPSNSYSILMFSFNIVFGRPFILPSKSSLPFLFSHSAFSHLGIPPRGQWFSPEGAETALCYAWCWSGNDWWVAEPDRGKEPSQPSLWANLEDGRIMLMWL